MPPSASARRTRSAHALEDLLKRTEANELMVTTQTHDPADRLRSFQLLAEAAAA